jgi:hypothetical protein
MNQRWRLKRFAANPATLFALCGLIAGPVINLFLSVNAAGASAAITTKVSIGSYYYPSATAGGSDDYRCFFLDPKINQDAILSKVSFLPMNRPLIHHAIVFKLPANQVAAARALDAGGKGWPCFGGAGVGASFGSVLTTPWLSAWVPGRSADVAPSGYGYPFAKGEGLVLQIHYNLLAASMTPMKFDQSGVSLTYLPSTTAAAKAVKSLRFDLFPAPVELACPVGITGPLCDRRASLLDLAARTSPMGAAEAPAISLMCHQDPFNPAASTISTCDRTITKAETVIAAAPHMHLLGRSMKIEVNPNSAAAMTLLDRANYSFDDQSANKLAKPVLLKAGDTVRVTCTFDPKLRQLLPLLKKLPPRYVTWGEGSSDEMCLGVLIVSN